MTADLAALRPLLGRLQDLKRIRTPDWGGDRAWSFAQHRFCLAWGHLSTRQPADVAVFEAIRAVAATELAGIDATVLADAGLPADQIEGVYGQAVRAATAGLPQAVVDSLLAAVPAAVGWSFLGPEPWAPDAYVRLTAQPRAGATHPTKPRLLLDPAESHADHCYVVAVSAALLALAGGTDPARPFLAGLAHHLHNVWLPDAGYAGEELLAEHLRPVVDRLTTRALALLPPPLAAAVVSSFALLPAPDSPEAEAFHAADVLDRVLWMEGYERAARFRLTQAMDDLELVHPGPTQAFLNGVLAAAGVWPR